MPIPTCSISRRVIPQAPKPQPTNLVTTATTVNTTVRTITEVSRNTLRFSRIPILTRKIGTRNSVTPLVS
ncbi:MAG: hypothetical protein ABI999_11115 [Acidobacteriota bacterium]